MFGNNVVFVVWIRPPLLNAASWLGTPLLDIVTVEIYLPAVTLRRHAITLLIIRHYRRLYLIHMPLTKIYITPCASLLSLLYTRRNMTRCHRLRTHLRHIINMPFTTFTTYTRTTITCHTGHTHVMPILKYIHIVIVFFLTYDTHNIYAAHNITNICHCHVTLTTLWIYYISYLVFFMPTEKRCCHYIHMHAIIWRSHAIA